MIRWKMSVPVYRFASETDYPKSPNGNMQVINLNIPDIYRYSLANAKYRGRTPNPLQVVSTYFFPVLGVLEPDRKSPSFCARSSVYEIEEESFKRSHSFLLGMTAAQAVFDKLLRRGKGGGLLLHAKDGSVYKVKKNSNLTPDYIGLDTNGRPYVLVEAKGTNSRHVGSTTVKHAKEQLNIRSVDCYSGTTFCYSVPAIRLEKHVVASSFIPQDKCADDVLTFADIDPEGEGETTLHLDVQNAVKKYYGAVMNVLEDGHNVEVEEVLGIKYKVAQIGPSLKVGLIEELEHPLLEFTDNHPLGNRESSPEPLFNLLGKYQTQIDEIREEKIGNERSLGADGLFVEIDEHFLSHYWHARKCLWRYM